MKRFEIRHLFNVDGTPMAGRNFDIKGKRYGQLSPPKPLSPPTIRPLSSPPVTKPFGKR
jgi:hypothetical protein